VLSAIRRFLCANKSLQVLGTLVPDSVAKVVPFQYFMASLLFVKNIISCHVSAQKKSALSPVKSGAFGEAV
jgi:hypothetical protein